MLSLKNKIIAAIIIIGLALIALFYRGIYGRETAPQPVSQSTQTAPSPNSQNQEPKVVATNPNSLEEAVLLPSQTIEFTFNYPLIAPSEFKNRLDPPAEIKIELSADKKTARVVPVKPYKLGSGYTFFILPDTKFEGGKALKDQIIYHFKTIGYRGV